MQALQLYAIVPITLMCWALDYEGSVCCSPFKTDDSGGALVMADDATASPLSSPEVLFEEAAGVGSKASAAEESLVADGGGSFLSMGAVSDEYLTEAVPGWAPLALFRLPDQALVPPTRSQYPHHQDRRTLR